MSFFCVALFRLFVSKFRYFELRVASFRHFAWRFFVISSFCVASFRYFVFSRGVFSLFRYFALRYFVFSRGVISLFRYFVGVISWQKDEKTKWHKSATIHRGYNFGHFRMYMAPYHIFWINFKSDMVISYTYKLLVF